MLLLLIYQHPNNITVFCWKLYSLLKINLNYLLLHLESIILKETRGVCVCVYVCGIHVVCGGVGGGDLAMTNGFELVGPNGWNKEENLNQPK